MITRFLITWAWFTSAAAGVGVGLFVAQVSGPDHGRQDVKSITGVSSGVDGTQTKQTEKEGVKGTEGLTSESQSSIEILTTNDGKMQSIRGIKGIDTVMLQNLEAVLRMQAPPPPPQGGGAVRAAAALLTMGNDETPGPETETDDRKELTELELEGS